jgi:hypothetical protein
MEIDYQVLFNISTGGVVFLLGWFVRIAYDAALSMRQDLDILEKALPVMYIRKEDYKDDIREIKEVLHTINTKLDNKADKSDCET